MKTVRIIKVLDVAVQLALTIRYVVMPYGFPELFGDYGSVLTMEMAFFTWLVAFGGWQVVSWLLNWAAPRELLERGARRVYGFMLIPAPLLMWTIFYYPVPMAIFYFTICCVELFKKPQPVATAQQPLS